MPIVLFWMNVQLPENPSIWRTINIQEKEENSLFPKIAFPKLFKLFPLK
jgi:hypothetical protein